VARSPRHVTRPKWSWLVGAALVASCSGQPADPYPFNPGPPHTAQLNPARLGQPTQASVLFIRVRPGDMIELLDAQAIGSLEGATVTFYLSRPVIHDTGEHVIGEQVEALRGAQVKAAVATDSPDNTVGIVGELVAQRPGRYAVTSLRLRYRINGGEERSGEGIDVVWTVCADDPAPDDCPEAPT
jgi:hypothetical protein